MTHLNKQGVDMDDDTSCDNRTLRSHRHPSSYGQTYPPDGIPSTDLRQQLVDKIALMEGDMATLYLEIHGLRLEILAAEVRRDRLIQERDWAVDLLDHTQMREYKRLLLGVPGEIVGDVDSGT